MERNSPIAEKFQGRWRIVEMDNWSNDYLDLMETAHITFTDASDGEIAFGALIGWLDVRYGMRDGQPCAEFSWQGQDNTDSASGRGWLTMDEQGRILGRLFIHCGEESSLVCEE